MKKLLIFSLVFGAVQLNAQVPTGLSLVNAIDDKEINLSEYATGKGLVVIFTSNNCPYDEYYQSRIKHLAKEYNGNAIKVVLVNSYSAGSENAAAMKKYAEGSGYTIPYLSDKGKKLMMALGATKSPEVFLLKREDGSFTTFYKGAIDNNPQVPADVKESYLLDNIDKLLSGEAANPAEIRTTGCRIK